MALGTTTTLRAGTGVEIRSAELKAAHSPERRINMRFCSRPSETLHSRAPFVRMLQEGS